MKKTFAAAWQKNFSARGIESLTEENRMVKLKKSIRGGKNRLAQVKKIALESQASLKRVGEGLNQLKNKIHQRQLGCFQAGQKVRGANGDGLTR